ncbi:Meiosis mei2 [Fusarium acutatum]|uniref:Meiosis mei2 n=1 Tax=Fusarium acutatum TaxID=78861 RepID=A0A8H4NFH5_9HYPO|nr:Meiosis mei2 [Fusarium acutatum]
MGFTASSRRSSRSVAASRRMPRRPTWSTRSDWLRSKLRRLKAKFKVRRRLKKDASAAPNVAHEALGLVSLERVCKNIHGQHFGPPAMAPDNLVSQRDAGFAIPNGFGRVDPRRGAGRYGRGSRGLNTPSIFCFLYSVLASGPGCVGLTARTIVRDLHSATPTQPGL